MRPADTQRAQTTAQRAWNNQQTGRPVQSTEPLTYRNIWPAAWGTGPSSAQIEIVVQTRALTRVYGKQAAVQDFNLTVGRGQVFGLLGPRGAGKTTLLRMLLKLIRPTSGEVLLFGQPLATQAERLLPRIGALIERPSFQPYLNGYDNLLTLGACTGGVTSRRIEETLQAVGLAGRGRERYSTYTPSMRQRLAIGAALLTDPELIILDEPCNDLDPASIADLRNLLRRLASLGKTIILASRTLDELREICARIGIIRWGRLIAEGTAEEILHPTVRWAVEISNPEKVRQLLQDIEAIEAIKVEAGRVIIDSPGIRGQNIIYFLACHDLWPDSVQKLESDLEQAYIQLTRREGRR
ncbi:ABC transporter ATP-binding protein [Ktedonosporobacter rubrisoli]|nr:ATP-binding cassette domain-containing protein [Ktedonosporobacter rubrisoli]